MGKVGINVGEDFPAEEVAPAERGPEDDVCRDREEWRKRARAFKDDVRGAARRHFGEHSFAARKSVLLRAVLAVALVALVLAVLPHVLIVAMLLLGIVYFLAHRGHFHHYDQFQMPHGDI